MSHLVDEAKLEKEINAQGKAILPTLHKSTLIFYAHVICSPFT